MGESLALKKLPESFPPLSLVEVYENVFYTAVDFGLVEHSMNGIFSDQSLDLDMDNQVNFISDKRGDYLGFQEPGTILIVFNVAKIKDLAAKYKHELSLGERSSIHMALARVYHHEMWHVVSDTGFKYGGYETQEASAQSVDVSMRAFNEAVTEFLTQMSFSQYCLRTLNLQTAEQDILYKDYALLIREMFYLISDLNYKIDKPDMSADKFFESFWKKVVQGYVSKDIGSKKSIFDEFETVLGGDFFFLLSQLGSPDEVFEGEHANVLGLLHSYIGQLREFYGLKTRKTFIEGSSS